MRINIKPNAIYILVIIVFFFLWDSSAPSRIEKNDLWNFLYFFRLLQVFF